MVIGPEALDTAVTDSSTFAPSAKLGGLMARLTAIEGGAMTGSGLIPNIGPIAVGDGERRGLGGR